MKLHRIKQTRDRARHELGRRIRGFTSRTRALARSRIGVALGYLSDYIGRCSSSPLVDTHARAYHCRSSPRGDAPHVHPGVVSRPGVTLCNARLHRFYGAGRGRSSNPPLSLFISISEPRVKLFSLALFFISFSLPFALFRARFVPRCATARLSAIPDSRQNS